MDLKLLGSSRLATVWRGTLLDGSPKGISFLPPPCGYPTADTTWPARTRTRTYKHTHTNIHTLSHSREHTCARTHRHTQSLSLLHKGTKLLGPQTSSPLTSMESFLACPPKHGWWGWLGQQVSLGEQSSSTHMAALLAPPPAFLLPPPPADPLLYILFLHTANHTSVSHFLFLFTHCPLLHGNPSPILLFPITVCLSRSLLELLLHHTAPPSPCLSPISSLLLWLCSCFLPA